VLHARDPFAEPAGGGAVAAVQLARLAGSCTLFTALGRDQEGERSVERLGELGVTVHAARLAEPTRRAITLIDDDGERTITTLGARLEPAGDDDVGSAALDGVYFTAGDLSALRQARSAARFLVASPRARHALGHGVRLDALVLSAEDEVERRAAAAAEGDADAVVLTEGAQGGSFRLANGAEGRFPPAPVPGELLDAYGCGDSFAAGVTYGLAAGLDLAGALAVGARCGATCLAGRGPYGRQLEAREL
jgi:ribokinase